MSGNHLDTPPFIQEARKIAVNTVSMPPLHNNGGTSTYLSKLPSGSTPLIPATTQRAVVMGHEYIGRPVRTLNQGISA